MRAAIGCSDRGHTAVSQLKAGDIDWDRTLAKEGGPMVSHRLHLAALSEAHQRSHAKRRRVRERTGRYPPMISIWPSLWKSFRWKGEAQEVNQRAPAVDRTCTGGSKGFIHLLPLGIRGSRGNRRSISLK
jgi:2-dehydro-3-deoxygluconokinase